MYQSSFCDAKAPVKADSGLTYNIPVPRKRSRDWMSNQQSVFDVSSLFGEELSLQMQQQQLEIDRLIAENTEKVRLEVQERRKRQSRMLVNAIHQGIGKKLKEKDEEIQRIGKLNWLLQERVRTLSVLAHVTEERQCGGGGGEVAQQKKRQSRAAEATARRGGVWRGKRKRRHLCICTACGSTTLTTCPVCNSVINASIHVNMS
ncbi:E3 ubiquitin-protein ligase BOI [Vitis vinifera]|uniref:E3 ubiquitin-protein ligase BOI n=1 Tax=Vitis vinifera TaxID=29760 RepID=A0A438DGP6_VITVI|nr:E3 ubiquitin-protein ligase BOI [Vitis vinifera]